MGLRLSRFSCEPVMGSPWSSGATGLWVYIEEVKVISISK